MHAGQIVLPYPGGRVRSRTRGPQVAGLYRDGGTVMHVSPGLGTTFVPVPLLRAAGGHGAGATITVMEGHATISADVLGSYAADAAREVAGVHGLVEGRLHRHRGVRVEERDGAIAVELHLSLDWGANVRGGRARGAGARGRLPRAHGGRDARCGRRRRRRDRPAPARLMPTRVTGLTAGRCRTRRRVCHELRLVAVARQQDRVEGALDREGRGGVGRVGHDLLRRRRARARLDAVRAGVVLPARGRPAGGPAVGRRRARHLRLPRRSARAVLVEQSLFLAAIGEARDKGARALEAFAYRYPQGESTYERFLVHRTVFPRDFLEDFGFLTLRAQGNVELMRLELGGLQPVEEGRRAKVLRVVQEAFTPRPRRSGQGRRAGNTGPRCAFRATRISSLGQRCAHSNETKSKRGAAPSGGRTSIRFSTTKPFACNNRIHWPCVGWNSTGLSSENSTR